MESDTDLGVVGGEAAPQAPGGKDVDEEKKRPEHEVLGTCIFRARRGSRGAWDGVAGESERPEGKSK